MTCFYVYIIGNRVRWCLSQISANAFYMYFFNAKLVKLQLQWWRKSQCLIWNSLTELRQNYRYTTEHNTVQFNNTSDWSTSLKKSQTVTVNFTLLHCYSLALTLACITLSGVPVILSNHYMSSATRSNKQPFCMIHLGFIFKATVALCVILSNCENSRATRTASRCTHTAALPLSHKIVTKKPRATLPLSSLFFPPLVFSAFLVPFLPAGSRLREE